ncbi:MAG: hypothetical protein HC812_10330 [Leptolyngbya sp. RL_3_1]|nr:hypothetical protein [Leptolyngbya sp. RL_3_1]
MTRNFCFGVLALNPKYQALAKSLATDLATHGPGITLVVGTDNPGYFRNCSNVSAFQLHKRGILHCYHDKRFVIEKALTQFETVIQIDADTQITHPIPENIPSSPGISAVHIQNILLHAQYAPERLPHFHQLAAKLDVDLSQVSFVGESLFAVSARGDQAQAFIQHWHLIARYLELRGIHAGEGNTIGIAAAKAGLAVQSADWLESINQARRHTNASTQASAATHPPSRVAQRWQQLARRISYHYRLNQARLLALKHFDFYYR